MRRARSALAFAAVLMVALVVTQSAFAHLPGRAFCSAKQPAKVELKCGKRAFYHGLGASTSLRSQLVQARRVQDAQAVASVKHSLNDHLWLMKAGRKWINEAHHRLAPPVAACGASTAACAWYADGATQCEVSYEGGFSSVNPAGYYGRFQMDISFQQETPYGKRAYATWGTADHWPEGVQIQHAFEVWSYSGWGRWPPYYVHGCAYWHGRVYRG